jgi:hypothetical protein
MSEVSEQIFKLFGPNKDMALEFFAVFSRFECPLKCVKDTRCGDDKNIKADWGKYALMLTNGKTTENIEKAAKYLLDCPPGKQEIKGDGTLGWTEKTEKVGKHTKIIWIFDMINIVRNNLLHGGKYEG